MQLHLSLLMAALASLPVVVQAVRLPGSPRTSLQNRQKAREVYQRRQASAKDIIRRRKDGPSKRQPSQVVCTDTSGGANKLTNGGFELDSINPWSLSSEGASGGTLRGTSGVDTGAGGDTHGFVVTGRPGTVTLTQSIDVCAGSTYSFSFYSGVAESVGTSAFACEIIATIGGVTLSEGQPCNSARPCSLSSAAGGDQYRMDSATYTPTSSGSVQVGFLFSCASGAEDTLLDQVSVSKVVSVVIAGGGGG